MKFKLAMTFFILTIFSNSCTQKSKYGKPVEEPSAIVKNIISFLEYRDKNINLYQDLSDWIATQI